MAKLNDCQIDTKKWEHVVLTGMIAKGRWGSALKDEKILLGGKQKRAFIKLEGGKGLFAEPLPC